MSDLLLQSQGGDDLCTDVVIIGTGPSGYMLANNLARYGIRVIALDRRAHRINAGHASGIQPRTQEIFHTLNLMRELEKGAGRFDETAFWSRQDDKLTRTDIEKEIIGTSRFPYIMICTQNYIEDAFDKDLMERGVTVQRPSRLEKIYYDNEDKEYPVRVRAQDMSNNTTHEFKAKYAVACDGANSQTIQHLGFRPKYYSTPEVWMVVDCGEVETDFPDIRRRCPIRTSKGAFQLIPLKNEAVRVYNELSKVDVEELERSQKESLTGKPSELDMLRIVQRNASDALQPYKIKLSKIQWISEYHVQQKILDKYSDGRNVLFVGDACHSHSPKAAQGLNAGVIDSYNLAWKLALVVKGHAKRSLLDTYQHERRNVAQELIDFDIEFGKLFTEKESKDSEKFHQMYQKSKGFTSGLDIRYDTSNLIAKTPDGVINAKAPMPIIAGARFYTPQVIRHKDGTPLDLADDLPPFGRFHIIVFAGLTIRKKGLDELSKFLISKESPLTRFSKSRASKWRYEHYNHLWPPHDNADKVVDLAVVHAEKHLELELQSFPEAFQDWQLRIYEDVDGKYHRNYGVDVEKGALVLVRPDECVSMVTGLDGSQKMADFLSSFMIPAA